MLTQELNTGREETRKYWSLLLDVINSTADNISHQLQQFDELVSEYKRQEMGEQIKRDLAEETKLCDNTSAYYYVLRYGQFRLMTDEEQLPGITECIALVSTFTKSVSWVKNLMVLLYTRRGNVYRTLKQFQNSVNDHTKVLEMNPNYSTAYNNRALAFMELQMNDKALKDLTIAIQMLPTDFKASFNRAVLHHDMMQFMEAINDYSTVIALGKWLQDALYNRSLCYEAIDQHIHALADARLAFICDKGEPYCKEQYNYLIQLIKANSRDYLTLSEDEEDEDD